MESIKLTAATLGCFSDSIAISPTGLLSFSYSCGQWEYYSSTGHRIPFSAGYWLSSDENLNLVRTVIVGTSALDVLKYFQLNRYRFKNTGELLLISIGSAGAFPQELKHLVTRRKIILLFPPDFLNTLVKVKLAFFLLDKAISLSFRNEVISITCHSVVIHIGVHEFSLNKVFRQLKIRQSFSCVSIKSTGNPRRIKTNTK